MSTKHTDPEFQRNRRIIRAQVTRARKQDQEVQCWRCGYPIYEEQTFDVGHIRSNNGHGLDNLAPEHRYKLPWCVGNRSAGGRVGAAITNSKKTNRKTYRTWT